MSPPRGAGRRRHPFRALVASAAFALTAGCSGSSPTQPAGPPSPSSVEAGSYARLNQARRDNGRPELPLDPALAAAARQHSQRMRDLGFFDHEDPSGGGNLAMRLAAAGVTYSLAGENLAFVSSVSDPAARAHDLLMGNPDHRSNILDDRFAAVGVGVASQGNTFWITQIFVRP
jgi:uncharacterized protein YkwD